MSGPSLQSAVASIPAGCWAVGVSGGADSVALLSLLLQWRPDLSLVVVHLDHETRGGASAADAQFVEALAERHHLPCVIATRLTIERELQRPPSNVSARWRAARLELFRRVVRDRQLNGVLLGHHADDQAETVLQRLLRGSGPRGLAGMARQASVGGLLVVRPLLTVRRQALRDCLAAQNQPWREDQSNVSTKYGRNRVRRLLSRRPVLVEPLLEVGEACAELRAWLREAAPTLQASFDLTDVRALPLPLAREALRRWLVQRGAAAGEVDAAAVERLLLMTQDAASPARQHFPGGVLVCRRRGKVFTADH